MLVTLLNVILLSLVGQSSAEPVTLTVAETLPIAFSDTHHVQGLAADDRRFYLSSVEKEAHCGWLFVIDRRSMKVVRQLRLALGDQYHPGGMQLVDGTLYIPLAEYRPKSSASILAIDTKRFGVRVVARIDDHVGAAAVQPDGTMYLANWDAKEIIKVEPDGTIVSRTPNPTKTAFQDLEWHDGELWGCGTIKRDGEPVAVIDVFAPDSSELRRRYLLTGEPVSSGTSLSREGMTIEGRTIWMAPEDGPATHLYRFDLP